MLIIVCGAERYKAMMALAYLDKKSKKKEKIYGINFCIQHHHLFNSTSFCLDDYFMKEELYNCSIFMYDSFKYYGSKAGRDKLKFIWLNVQSRARGIDIYISAEEENMIDRRLLRMADIRAESYLKGMSLLDLRKMSSVKIEYEWEIS